MIIKKCHERGGSVNAFLQRTARYCAYAAQIADIGSYDLPALVALDNSGHDQVVNYRLQGRRYMVDRPVDRAELVAGVGGSQDKVTITRRAYR